VSRGQRGGTPKAVHLSFLDRSRYFIIQVAPQLSSGGRVDPVPNPMLRRKTVPGIEPETSATVGTHIYIFYSHWDVGGSHSIGYGICHVSSS
jgi:hypothetical protein